MLPILFVAILASQQDQRVSVRDSAGVQIVEYAGQVKNLPIVFRFASAPLLDLGGQKTSPAEELDTGPYDQTGIRLSDGRIVVRDFLNLKLFDARGRYLSTIGRVGDGPGEFRRVTGLCVLSGDTIVAIERNRVSVFTGRGSHVRTFGSDAALEPSGCFRDASLLSLSGKRADAAAPAYQVATGSRIALDGRQLNEIAALDRGSSSPPVQLIASAWVRGDLVYAGDGRTSEIKVFRSTGGLSRIIRWNDPGIALTREAFTIIMGKVYSELSADALQAQITRLMLRPQPAALPRYQSIIVDDAGRIWVVDYPDLTGRTSAPTAWTVFDSIGRPIGRVAQPLVNGTTGAGLVWIGRDEVLLRWRDTNGFAHLTFHALERVR